MTESNFMQSWLDFFQKNMFDSWPVNAL